jgi:AraC family transcriptional activator of mtrCDE
MRVEAQQDAPGTEAILSSLCDALLAMVLRSAGPKAERWQALDRRRGRAPVQRHLLGDGRPRSSLDDP